MSVPSPLTEEQKTENLRVAYEVMSGIPAARVYLSTDRGILDPERGPRGTGTEYDDDRFLRDCGSVGCICGWLSAHPYFQAQGLRVYNGGGLYHALGMSTPLFGVHGIFAPGHYGLAGKREALARLRDALYDRGAITSARNIELIRYENALTE